MLRLSRIFLGLQSARYSVKPENDTSQWELFLQPMAIATTSGGLIAATRPGDQPRGGRGNREASRRPTPRWYMARNQRMAQEARKFAAVTRSAPRTARAHSRYESAWMT